MRPKSTGQVLIGVVILVVFLMILIPAIVQYVQNETKWTVKEVRTTRAFELAESAVDRGFQQLIMSTSAWANIQAGTIPTSYNFDQVYSDLSGGQYEIRISSGPQTQQATIVAVGRDLSKNELRAVKAIYANQNAGNFAINAGNTVTVGASVNVEWGAVTSYTSIASGGRLHPRFYSTGNITPQDPNGPPPPNTDNVQWWSYKTDLPPAPQVDLNSYQSSAQNAGVSPPGGCSAAYYTNGSVTFKGCLDTTNHTYYITGDATFSPGSGGNFILGNVIVQGNINITGNGGTGRVEGSYNTPIPLQAWKEYGNDWGTYQCMDAAAPATYAAAQSVNYSATTIVSIPNGCINGSGSVLVHGFLYAGGASGLNGGGNSRFHGAVYTPGTVTVATSNHTIYFDNTVSTNIRYVNITVVRTSWQEITGCSWSGTNPTCP